MKIDEIDEIKLLEITAEMLNFNILILSIDSDNNFTKSKNITNIINCKNNITIVEYNNMFFGTR